MEEGRVMYLIKDYKVSCIFRK